MVTFDDIQRAVACEAPAFGIAQAFLFGSYARGEQRPDSDVDIVVELSRPLGFKRAQLSESLQNRLGVPVDVVFGSNQLYAPVFARYEKDKVALYEA
ncbi:MAG: nucleotidyltransferase domain-containing protein [Eggerthellaceae bacterium]|nr:nucleotidyltransferase domain-containing protein [Eggerthellaceae bacterium]